MMDIALVDPAAVADLCTIRTTLYIAPEQWRAMQAREPILALLPDHGDFFVAGRRIVVTAFAAFPLPTITLAALPYTMTA